MTLEEKLEAIDNLERVLSDYSAFFVDWFELHANKDYRVEFPLRLTKAMNDIKLIAAELGKT